MAQEFPNLVNEKMNKKVSAEALQQMALIVCSADIESWEDLVDMTDLERDLLMKTMSAGQAQLVRRIRRKKEKRRKKKAVPLPPFTLNSNFKELALIRRYWSDGKEMDSFSLKMTVFSPKMVGKQPTPLPTKKTKVKYDVGR